MTELARRIAITIGELLVFRFGFYIPLPGITIQGLASSTSAANVVVPRSPRLVAAPRLVCISPLPQSPGSLSAGCASSPDRNPMPAFPAVFP